MLTGNDIKTLLENIKSDIVQDMTRLNFIASGKTITSFEIESNDVSGELSAPRHMMTLVEDRFDGGKGRKPGRFAPPDSILAYIESKGIKPDDPKMPLRSLAYLINRSLKENGNSVFRGEPGLKLQPIYDRNVDVFIKQSESQILDRIYQSLNKMKV